MDNSTQNKSTENMPFGCGFLLIGISAIAFGGETLFGGIFITAGLLFVASSIFTYWKSTQVGSGNIELGKSTEDPISWVHAKDQYQVGEQFEIELSYALPRERLIESLEVELVRQEITKYRTGGRYKRTVKRQTNKVIRQYKIDRHQLHPNTIFERSFQFQIPHDSIHTLDLGNNKIKWFLQVCVTGKGVGTIYFEKHFTVLPIMARSIA